MKISEETYYMIILLCNFLITFSFVPIVYETTILKMTKNIPYISLIMLIISFGLLMTITYIRNYWIHVFIYFVGFISCVVILMNKKEYDSYYTKVRINEKNDNESFNTKIKIYKTD
jgi:hypothetical protein